ncbi:hypothetical protein [Plantactinospora sp. WMMB782]|uniref:hypothetical protein n=1 Tax=Plantactinospora sp. WMMB782 TaxID=3404121 RepID=UPI003B953EE7
MTQRTGQVSEERRGEERTGQERPGGRRRHRPDIRYAAGRKARTNAAGPATGGPE